MKVMLCLPDFSALGVQRVVATLANAWPRERARLLLCVHHKRGALLDTLPPAVEVVELGLDVPKLRVLLRPLLHARAIAAHRPDVVVSFVPGDNLSLLSLPRRRFALAVSEHTFVSAQIGDYPLRFRAPYRALFPRLYPRADAIVCVAEEAREDLVTRWRMPREKTVVIHNPIDLLAVREGARAEASVPLPGPVVIAVGRLSKEKRIDRLLGAVALLQRRRPVSLLLVGDGPQRAALEQRARALGVPAHFTGFEKNPWRYLARADVYALSSDFEGFPCALAEALALGVPAVAVACPSGPRELLQGGAAGLLVEERTEAALAQALDAALTDRAAAAARAQRGVAFAGTLGAGAVAARYVALCERLSSGRPP